MIHPHIRFPLPHRLLIKIVCLGSLAIFYLAMFRPTEQNIFSISFVDEAANFTTGAWVARGAKMYEDFFLLHQPTTTLISAVIQKAIPLNSIFLLVKRHREFVFVFSFLSSAFLVWRFGPMGLFFAFFYELTKFTLFGNLFLAETLSIPPLLYCIGLVYERVKHRAEKVRLIDILFFLASLLFIQFTLLPLAFFVLFALLMFFSLSSSKERKKVFFLGSLVTMATLLAFSHFVSFAEYVRQTVAFTTTQFIPGEELHQSLATLVSQIFLFPIHALFLPNEGFFLIFKFFCVLFIILSLFLSRKRTLLVLLAYLLLVLTNTRPRPFALFYQGFHFLPLYASLVWIALLHLETFAEGVKQTVGKIAVYAVPLVILGVIIFPYGYKEFTRSNDPKTDWYVNYSPFFDYGETLRLLALPTDTLMVIPDVPLLYWQSGFKSNSLYFYTYGFMYKNPIISNQLLYYFRIHPPSFIYDERDLLADELIGTYAKEAYIPVLLRGKPSRLYVRKDSIPTILSTQWKQVERYGFSLH